MTATMPQSTQSDWVKTVLFDRGYLARIRGEAIKVYLAMIEACGGVPDQSVTISLNRLMRRTQLSCPTVIDCLSRLEDLGLVVSTTHQPGKVKTYYISDPPPARPEWSVIGEAVLQGGYRSRPLPFGLAGNRCLAPLLGPIQPPYSGQYPHELLFLPGRA
jgi:hypothetical protein